MTTTHPASALQAAWPSDDQILEVFAEFGRPNDEQCTMTYNAPQIVAAVRALLSKQHATASFHQDLSHPLELAPPRRTLQRALCQPVRKQPTCPHLRRTRSRTS